MQHPPFLPLPEDMPNLRRLAYTIAIAAVLMVIWRASDLLMLVFGSVLGAVVFRSTGQLIERRTRCNHKLALTLGTLVVLVLFGLTAWLLTAQFGRQLALLIANLPQTVASITGSLSGTPVGAALVAASRASVGGSTFADLLGKLSVGVGEIMVNFLVVMVGAMFISANPGVYKRGLVLLVPPSGRDQVDRALSVVGQALGLWLRAQLLCMTSMGVLIAFGLWLIGSKSWAALGLLAGLSEFVPYVGPVAAMLPALAVAAPRGGNQMLLVVLIYFVVRMAQSSLVTPFVTRSVVAIPPALTLFVILGVGAVFGVYGLFFSAALLVVFFVLVRELYLRDTLGEDISAVPHGGRDAAILVE
jgi:predicted PurR-regulated permease PerM